MCIYSSDAEVFNFRPGRYQDELESDNDEWLRIEELLCQLKENFRFCLVKNLDISDAVLSPKFDCETPVYVKKQQKYNINRWSVTGRKDREINQRCFYLYNVFFDRMSIEEKKILLKLWSSDYRTHIEDQRWLNYLKDFAEFEQHLIEYYPDVSDKPNLDLERFKSTPKQENNKFSIDMNVPIGVINCIKSNEMVLLKSVYHADFIYADEAADFISGGMFVFDQMTNTIFSDYDCSSSFDQNEKLLKISSKISNSQLELLKTVSHFTDCDTLEFNWNLFTKTKSRRIIRFGNFLMPSENITSIFSGNFPDGFEYSIPKVGFSHTHAQSEKVSATSCIPCTTGAMSIRFRDGDILHFHFKNKESYAAVLVKTLTLNGVNYLRIMFSCSEIDDTSKLRVDNIKFGVKITHQITKTLGTELVRQAQSVC